MKVILLIFGALFLLALAALYGSVLYLNQFDFGSTHLFFEILWNSVRRFFQYGTWGIPLILVTIAVGLILIAGVVLMVKLMRQRKFLLSLFGLVLVTIFALFGLLGFVPWLNEWPSTVPNPADLTMVQALLAIIEDPNTTVAGYLVAGSFGAITLVDLILLVLILIDVVETPYALGKVKKVKVVAPTNQDPVATELNKFEIPGAVKPTPEVATMPSPTPDTLAVKPQPAKASINPTPLPPSTPAVAPSTAAPQSLTDQLRAMIQEELKKNAPKDGDPFKGGPVMVATPWGYQTFPTGMGMPQQPGIYPQQAANQGITATNTDEVRTIVLQEIERSVGLKKEIAKLVMEEIVRLAPPSKESVYSIINEELIKYDSLNREAIDSLVNEKVEKNQQGELDALKLHQEQQLTAMLDARLESLKNSLVAHQEQWLKEELSRQTALLKKEWQTSGGSNGATADVSESTVKKVVLEEMAKFESLQLKSIRAIFTEELAAFIASRKKTEPVAGTTAAMGQAAAVVKLEPLPPSAASQDVKAQGKVDIKPSVAATLEEEKDDAFDDDDQEDGVIIRRGSNARLPQFESVVPKDSPLTKTGKKKIIKIPFRERMKLAAPDLLENYDDLKNYILSYKVKSRLSHSGDTFRLHRKDFIKITIAGKGLKLYYALNPQDYQNSTFPIGDASRKDTYREIPLFFKVKSALSVKRAKALVDDLMKKRNLVQRGLLNIKWSEEFKS